MAKVAAISSAQPTLADEALIAGIEAGDSSALEALYDRYSAAVYGLALRVLSSAPLAEEVVQDTFWRVWRRSATFQAERGHVASWLLGIAHNLCIDELRRQRARVQLAVGDEAQLLALPHDGLPVEEEVWLRERRHVIAEALAQLPLEQRSVIELAYFGGLSQREIAEHTGEALGTVKTRVRLGLRKLKELLAGPELGVEDAHP